MEEIKTKGIILSTSDYGEADKIALVFSLEYGKISIKFNGVRKQTAKLKILTQPFSYVELECFKRGDYFTVKTGALIDCFPQITVKYSRTICAYIISEIISKILPKNKIEPEIFLCVVESFDAVEKEDEYFSTIKFILRFFDLLGEKLSTDINSNHIYIDLNLGNFSSERTFNSIEIDKKCYKALTEKADTNTNKMTLKMLNNIIRAKYDVEINSFSFL